ncbi:MAG: asparagine--tRNA ligase [Deltaproteobacteria bacterium]|nr:asparagine--tRNA ligase [Deltaproteobacteria bacterium]
MNEITINNIGTHEGQTVTLNGWMIHKRSSGKVRFLVVRDGTGTTQVTLVKSEMDEEHFELYHSLTLESSLTVTGIIKKDDRAPGGYEVLASQLNILQTAEEYPIAEKEHGVGFLLDHRHLWLRSSKQHAILRIRHTVIQTARRFFDDRGFILLDAPIMTPVACEGTTTLFETDYFEEQKAYLSQSGQLYMEAGAMAFGKVYCCGPTFRAEKSKTRRHLTEFWMIEPEIAFAGLPDIMELAEALIVAIVKEVLSSNREDLRTLERDVSKLERIEPPFESLSYDRAVRILHNEGVPFERGSDFGGGDETLISDQFEKPVFIHRYPASSKPFYMKNDPEKSGVVLCMDLLAPEGYGEIIGGSAREEDFELLSQKLGDAGLSPEAFSWYLDLRKYGSVPHAGFGMGIERTVAWICGVPHVRETIPFPRLMQRLYP